MRHTSKDEYAQVKAVVNAASELSMADLFKLMDWLRRRIGDLEKDNEAQVKPLVKASPEVNAVTDAASKLSLDDSHVLYVCLMQRSDDLIEAAQATEN